MWDRKVAGCSSLLVYHNWFSESENFEFLKSLFVEAKQAHSPA